MRVEDSRSLLDVVFGCELEARARQAFAAALFVGVAACADSGRAPDQRAEMLTPELPSEPAASGGSGDGETTETGVPVNENEPPVAVDEAEPPIGVNEGTPDVAAGELEPPNAEGAGAPDPASVSGPAFAIDVLTRAGIGGGNSTGWPNVGVARAGFDWQTGPFARVLLLVDLESTCYPFESWAANPPPAGQNWPADCDAFDRNFNVFVEDVAASRPPFEVIHAITPFGGPEHLEVDLTDLANALPGAQALRVAIESYSDPAGLVTGSNGGWTVSARLEVTPGVAPRPVLAALPLYAGRLEAGDPAPVIPFVIPAGTTGGLLEYRTSGHGQGAPSADCIGPAEEFCSRRHRILVDAVQVQDINPIRVDCDTLCTLTHYGPPDAGFDYCLENPGGLPDSVRAPRANWCPGSMTPPFLWTDIPALATPGPHSLSFEVSQIEAGGNWLVSATYYAYGTRTEP
jgi:hypothetical protein